MSVPRRPSQIDRLRLIARIAGGMHEERPLEALLQDTADAIHDMLGFPNVDIPMLDPEDPFTLVVRIRGGHYKQAIRQVDRIPLGRGIMGAAVRSRRTELVNDVRLDPRYVCPPGVEAAVAEMATPIRVAGEVVGVINVESREAFDEADRLSIESVADFLGVAIRNLRLLPGAREAAVLLERQRLARELHDNVTQILSSISLLTQTIDSAWRRDPAEGARRVARLGELAQTAFVEMRMLLRELSPPPTSTPRPSAGSERREQALPEALRALLAVMAPEELRVVLEPAGYVPQQRELEEALYRVCQEAVSNAVRHARAHHLRVTATTTEEHAVLRVADDGCGLGTEFRPGLGLSGMRARVESAGGLFRVTPSTPRGTLIEARLPRADRRD